MDWNDYAHAYATLMEHNSLYTSMRDQIVQYAKDAPSVVDVGCGPGLILKNCKADRKIGIDFCPQMIAYAQKNTDATYYVADMHIDPIPSASVIICSNVIYTSHAPGTLLTALTSAAEDRLIITNPHPYANNQELGRIVMQELAQKNILETHPREVSIFVEFNKKNLSNLIHNSISEQETTQILQETGYHIRHHSPIFANQGYLLVADKCEGQTWRQYGQQPTKN